MLPVHTRAPQCHPLQTAPQDEQFLADLGIQALFLGGTVTGAMPHWPIC